MIGNSNLVLIKSGWLCSLPRPRYTTYKTHSSMKYIFLFFRCSKFGAGGLGGDQFTGVGLDQVSRTPLQTFPTLLMGLWQYFQPCDFPVCRGRQSESKHTALHEEVWFSNQVCGFLGNE